MRFHLLACPNAQTTKEYSLCGFAALTIRFANMMHDRGHTVFLYASEENEARCTELIPIIGKHEMQVILKDIPYQSVWFEQRLSCLWSCSNGRAIAGIEKRKQPGDFVLTISGQAHSPVFEWHNDLHGVEYSIGYEGTFARNRVFETHMHRQYIHGLFKTNEGHFFDEVIPAVFEPKEFSFQQDPEDYFLYVGRLTYKKGITLACEVAKKAGVKLKVVGHGDVGLVKHGAEYLGALKQDERNEVISKARAVICPTLYIEPFNCVAVEAQLCGVPVISTPWGGFVETIEQGVTGYRCTMFREFVQAIKDVEQLDRPAIRGRALCLYTPEVIGPQYERYFQRVAQMHGLGFYAE